LLPHPRTPSPLSASGLKFRDKFLATPTGSVSNQNCCKGFRFKEKVEKHCDKFVMFIQIAYLM